MNKCFRGKIADPDRWPVGCPITLLEKISDKALKIIEQVNSDNPIYILEHQLYELEALDIKRIAGHLLHKSMNQCIKGKSMCETL